MDQGRWLPRLLGGALAGIAVTETHGGSQKRGNIHRYGH
jgi:hypothetical protein